MATSTTEVVLLSYMTIDVNGTKQCCCSGLAGLFHIGKIHSNHTFLEPQEQSWKTVLRKTILVNVMDGCHTYYCVAYSCPKRFLLSLLMIM